MAKRFHTVEFKAVNPRDYVEGKSSKGDFDSYSERLDSHISRLGRIDTYLSTALGEPSTEQTIRLCRAIGEGE